MASATASARGQLAPASLSDATRCGDAVGECGCYHKHEYILSFTRVLLSYTVQRLIRHVVGGIVEGTSNCCCKLVTYITDGLELCLGLAGVVDGAAALEDGPAVCANQGDPHAGFRFGECRTTTKASCESDGVHSEDGVVSLWGRGWETVCPDRVPIRPLCC